MDKMDGMTMNIEQANVEKLRKVFPEVFADGKVDFDKLQGLLGHYIADDKEKYSFSWKGKADSLRLAQKRSTGTLRPCKEESKNWDTTENLYIEGDNLEVLKLLQSSYLNSIKMIYIDPPYNTGNDFVYTDDFADGIAHYKEVTGQATKSNPETAGRYHTNWLNMMYPRLKLARNLLTDDGVIFISIDDHEFPNLIKICNEVFGESNFVSNIIWQNKKGGGNDSTHIAIEHEYIVVFAKNKNSLGDFYQQYDEEYVKRYKEEDEKGKFFWDTFKRKSGKQYYPIVCPDGTILEKDDNGNPISWLRSENRFKQDLKEGEIRIIKINNSWSVQFKQRMPQGKTPRSIFTTDSVVSDQGTTSGGSADIMSLFKKDVFSNPKPVSLMKYIVGFGLSENDILLDFFSGSATMCEAILRANSEDAGHRKYIAVQLDENLDKNLDKADSNEKLIIQNAISVLNAIGKPHYITELAKERIRRAGEKIKEENKDKEGIENLDIGFKVFKLDSSNLVKWDNTPTTDEEEVKKRIQQSLFYLVEGREDLDLVYEIMLKYGLSLTLPVEERKFDGVTAYIINHPDYKVLVCLAPNITLSAVEEMDKETIGTYIFADRCFADANILSNTEEILKKKDKEMRLF